jgi:hypothetical protein
MSVAANRPASNELPLWHGRRAASRSSSTALPSPPQVASSWARQTWTSLPAALWALVHPMAAQVRRWKAGRAAGL